MKYISFKTEKSHKVLRIFGFKIYSKYQPSIDMNKLVISNLELQKKSIH